MAGENWSSFDTVTGATTEVGTTKFTATSTPVPGTLVLRDSSGRAQVADPALPEDIVNKQTFDAGVAVLQGEIDIIDAEIANINMKGYVTKPEAVAIAYSVGMGGF